MAAKGTYTINLKYDPAGNRVYKSSSTQGTRRYIVDISGGLPTILLEIDPADGLIKKTYMYANGEILMQYNGNHTADKYFYLHDRLGSVRGVIDSNATVVKYYTFDAFGKTIEEGGTLSNPFMFTGQYYDSEIGQYYLRARQYDPQLMRFSGRDTIVGDYNEPMTLHKYLYCLSNPINRIDPFGLDAYLLYASEGGSDWIDDILGENTGHIAIVVDTPNGKVIRGSAGWGNVYKPVVKDNFQKMLQDFTSSFGETKVMRFKNKTLGWASGATSDKRIYDYINGGLGKNMTYPYCSLFGQQCLAYGGYQLGMLNGIAPSWLWESAEWSAEYDKNVSPYSP